VSSHRIEETLTMKNSHHFRQAILAAVVAIAFCSSVAAADFDNGNLPLTVVLPRLVKGIRGVSPGANDASIILRIITFVQNGWFDALAPYHPTAVGVYSRIPRRPAAESATNRNKNIAAMYASYRVLNSLLPQNAVEWRRMMFSVGLDPADASTDTTTPVGIGNVAGMSLIAARLHDGMNQLGDEGGVKYNRRPYSDYTGYKPVNTAYELIDPSRWQPNVNTKGGGLFQVQQFVTPQYRLTKPYSYADPMAFHVPPPIKSDVHNFDAYKQQADEVLAASAALTDELKMKAEMFDDKIMALGTPGVWLDLTHRFTLDQFVQERFMSHLATFDAGIFVWQEKFRYDAVRPFTAIRYIYGDNPVTAWGGPGQGTVHDMPGKEWRSYMTTADHPEYPSASTCFCAAYAQANRRLLGTDEFGYRVLRLKGSSMVEPGITPSKSIVLTFKTFTDFVDDCGMARVNGGVHFLSAVEASRDVCSVFGDLAYEFVKAHIDGTAP
jgi:hypothetical protein